VRKVARRHRLVKGTIVPGMDAALYPLENTGKRNFALSEYEKSDGRVKINLGKGLTKVVTYAIFF
jgi:hypothetical protein